MLGWLPKAIFPHSRLSLSRSGNPNSSSTSVSLSSLKSKARLVGSLQKSGGLNLRLQGIVTCFSQNLIYAFLWCRWLFFESAHLCVLHRF